MTATSSTIYFTDSNGNLYSIPNTNYNGRYREPNTLSTNAKLHVYSLDRSIATYVNAGGHTDALQTKIPLANIYKQLAAKRTSNQSTIIGNLGICGLYSLDKTPMNNMSANIRRAFMFGPPTTNDYHIISLDLWYSYNGTDNSLNLYTPDSRATECLIDATTFEITNITVTKYDDWITNASNALFANGARIEIQDVYLEIGNDGNSSSGGATVTL